jgi:hypothetical protein
MAPAPGQARAMPADNIQRERGRRVAAPVTAVCSPGTFDLNTKRWRKFTIQAAFSAVLATKCDASIAKQALKTAFGCAWPNLNL